LQSESDNENPIRNIKKRMHGRQQKASK